MKNTTSGLVVFFLSLLTACAINEKNKIQTYQNIWRAKVEKTANELLTQKGKYRDISILGCHYKGNAEVIIDATGTLSSVQLQEKTGDGVVDDLIIEAIEKSSPYMPFSTYLPDSDKLRIDQTFVILPVASACRFSSEKDS